MIKNHPQEIPFIQVTGNTTHHAYRFSHYAMATVFEILIIHDDAKYAQQAAWEAFSELDHLEQDLSRFIENSDISRINNLAKNQSVQVGLDTFACLKKCLQLFQKTGGAFDVTVGPLVTLWAIRDKPQIPPSTEELFFARKNVNMNLIQLNETDMTVKVLSDSVYIDLGGIGKGYGLDQMDKLLTEWEIGTALLHGGYSSVLALKAAPGEKGWLVTISNPSDPKQTLALCHLQHQALSSSGLQKGKHIINPHTGNPVKDKIAAWAFTPNGVTSDGLSTAFMIMAPEEINNYCSANPDTQALVILKDNEKEKNSILKFGINPEKLASNCRVLDGLISN